MLIPWLVNGTLNDDIATGLRAHLSSCQPCHEDYEAQVRLSASMRAESPLTFAAESSFQKLLARIDSSAKQAGAVLREADTEARQERRSPLRAPPAVRWLAAAAALEALALGLLAWGWHSRVSVRHGTYVTLASPAPSYDSAEQVRVVFRKDLTVARLQVLLRSVDARIVEGPASAGVYTLGFAPATSKAAFRRRLAVLRADSAILFAEPVARGAPPP